ncbi:Protein kinase domain containing protein [Brugia malayi]|uniref:Bm8587 n=2 Tax=Brugia TaxID=6278 RepID=A0A1P6BP09_BRUMA|nr:Protein kinase domain containing protein [Brugia malayi]CRZ22507.1 Bm8587 [Brugia malayi]VIO99177.1 Protein kinase domain containing protein [Brugia malayi]
MRSLKTDDDKKNINFNVKNNSTEKKKNEICDLTTEKDKFMVSTNSRTYELVKYLGKGGYGEVYECISETTKRIYALKRENILRTKIPNEIEVLKKANECDCKQICKYVDDGRQNNYVFVVMTLLGKDLSKLRRESKTKSFSINTSLRVGLLTLSAIRELHEISVISRDIKPSNFALGINKESRNIYIFDFGLSRFYRNQDGSILPVKHHTVFRGTTRYASLRAHQKLELGRRDDLESWLYVMVELSSGTLPWKTPKRVKEKKNQLKEQVYRAKLRIRLGNERKEFFRNSLPILDCIFVMIDELAFEAEPPYEQIQYIFEKLMLETNVKWDDIYDWEEIRMTQTKQMISVDGMTSTSAAMATHSRYVQVGTTTLTASTESSALLPNVRME